MSGEGVMPLVFECRGETLLGILHPAAVSARTGVLIIVGGPQYRLGSHRQFVLLARRLAAAGVPVLRFDYRGMGDSGGDMMGFEAAGLDIAAAADAFIAACPGLSQIVLWGLCDAASAALFYAPNDQRVKGLILLNPWVRTQQGLARTYVRHYYLQRLLSPDFWSKVGAGGWKMRESIGSFITMLTASHKGAKRAGAAMKSSGNKDLPARMTDALEAYAGPVLFILSLHNDYVADEFRGAVAQSKKLQRLMQAPRVVLQELAGANHTFSRQDWRSQVEEWTQGWLARHFGGHEPSAKGT